MIEKAGNEFPRLLSKDSNRSFKSEANIKKNITTREGYLFIFPLSIKKTIDMELINQKTETLDETTDKNHLNQNEIVVPKTERVKSFRIYAFEKAGLNRGDFLALKTYLKWIKEGHLVDDTTDENEQHLLKQQLRKKITEKDAEKEKLEGDKRSAIEVNRPTIENKIKELTEEIKQTKIDQAENKIQTGYQPEKYFIYVGLTIILSCYLVFFYASAIYSSFFRNAGTILRNAGDDIVLYLDNIFDVNGIFTVSPLLIIVYLGAFLFFAIGLIPHSIEGKNKKLNIGLVVFGSFVADSLMAYKIDSGIHDLKIMAGIADTGWKFYLSINFYMVLVFGFCAYLVWGYVFEMMLTEKNKKKGDIKASLIIMGLKQEIKSLKEQLQFLEIKIIEIETQINAITSQVDQLKENLENNMLKPDALSQNLTSFYMGWIQYLNGTDLDIEKEKCEVAYDEFMKSLFNKEATQLN